MHLRNEDMHLKNKQCVNYDPQVEDVCFDTRPTQSENDVAGVALVAVQDHCGYTRSSNDNLTDVSLTASKTRSGRSVTLNSLDGRRIIEPKILIDRLAQGCDECGKTLSMTRVTHETKEGLGSYFWILCECGVLNKVLTSKQHYAADKAKTKPVFDINSKAAIGGSLLIKL